MREGIFWEERRKSPRFIIEDGVVKICGVHTDAATTRLLDLNKTGLSFQHMSVSPLAEKILRLDLLVVDRRESQEDLFFHGVFGEILSITELDGNWGRKGGRARRYGLRFIGLVPRQHKHLEHFLGWHNIPGRPFSAVPENHPAMLAH